MQGEPVAAAELRRWIRGDRERVGALAGLPVVCAEVSDTAEAEGLAADLAGMPCVMVGVAAGAVAPPDGYDVLLTGTTDPDRPWVAGLDRLPGLVDRIRANPHAGVTIAQLLRVSHGLPVAEALTAESMAYAMLQCGDEFRAWLATARLPASAPGEPVVERQGPALVVTLNRPAVRNAVNAATRDALVAACDLAADDPAVTELRLRAAGPAFSAGGDLSEFGQVRTPVLGHLTRATRSPARALLTSAVTVVAEVHGAAIGAGAELAACATVVRVHRNASFALPEQRMGLLPGAGGTVSITRRIGRRRCAYLALSGEPIDAATALAWGLADEIAG